MALHAHHLLNGSYAFPLERWPATVSYQLRIHTLKRNWTHAHLAAERIVQRGDQEDPQAQKPAHQSGVPLQKQMLRKCKSGV